jgi:2'-5' RNA ligase
MLNNKSLINEIVDKNYSAFIGVGLKNKISNWNEVLKYIDPADIYDDETKDYGLEHNPHVTLLYGLKNEISVNYLKDYLGYLTSNIEIKLVGISIFENDNYDVVKFTVESDDLKQINKKLNKLPNKQTYPEYVPHITIAYVKPSQGKKYVKKLSNPTTIDANTFIYSDGDKNSKNLSWKIKKKYKFPIELNNPNL